MHKQPPAPEPEISDRERFLKMLEFPRLLFEKILGDYRDDDLVFDWQPKQGEISFRLNKPNPKDLDFLGKTIFGYRNLDDRSIFKVWSGDFPQHAKEILTISALATSIGGSGIQRFVHITLDIYDTIELDTLSQAVLVFLEYANTLMGTGKYASFMSTATELEL